MKHTWTGYVWLLLFAAGTVAFALEALVTLQYMLSPDYMFVTETGYVDYETLKTVLLNAARALICLVSCIWAFRGKCDFRRIMFIFSAMCLAACLFQTTIWTSGANTYFFTLALRILFLIMTVICFNTARGKHRLSGCVIMCILTLVPLMEQFASLEENVSGVLYVDTIRERAGNVMSSGMNILFYVIMLAMIIGNYIRKRKTAEK